MLMNIRLLFIVILLIFNVTVSIAKASLSWSEYELLTPEIKAIYISGIIDGGIVGIPSNEKTLEHANQYFIEFIDKTREFNGHDYVKLVDIYYKKHPEEFIPHANASLSIVHALYKVMNIK